MKTIITALLALFAMTGWAQIKPDTITINFQLASQTKGEAATLVYPDFLSFENIALHPVTDGKGRWTVKIPTYRTLHIQIWDDNKIHGVVWGALNLFCRPGTRTDILLDDVNDRCIFAGENAEAHQAQITHPLKIEDFHGRMFNMDMQEATTCIRDIHEQNLHRIDTLSKAHPNLPNGYVEGLRTIADYGFAMDMTQNIAGLLVRSLQGSPLAQRGGIRATEGLRPRISLLSQSQY